ncbi:hypothetical protein CPB83DRAFT_841679 [Crepidotus variabilis]|uniref:Uncharacterized protein n=1 Tax=Crepidotus variabilis TaxID=179855 RepID=A0A9P6JWS6_9AGAR|nr:hypothetical protein CPB83DRAFT_841679 [Crepidotus variabilis]
MVKIGKRVASPPRRVKALQERVQKRTAQLESGTHITQLAEPRQNIALLQSRRTRHRYLAPSSLFGESRRRWEKNHQRLEGRKLAKAAKKMAESGLEGSDDMQAQELRDLPFHEQGSPEVPYESPGPGFSSGSLDKLSLSLESTAFGSFWDFPDLASLSGDDSTKTPLPSDFSGDSTDMSSLDGKLRLDKIDELGEKQLPDMKIAFLAGQPLQKPHQILSGVPSLLSETSARIFSRPLNPENYSSKESLNRSSRDPYLTKRTKIGVPANVFWSISSSGTSSGRSKPSRSAVLRFDELQEASSAVINSSAALPGHVLNKGIGWSAGLDSTVVGYPCYPISSVKELHPSLSTGICRNPMRSSKEPRTQFSTAAFQKDSIDRFNRRQAISRPYETPKVGASPRFALQDTPKMTHMAVIAPKIHARLALDMSTARPVIDPENRQPVMSSPIQVYRWRPPGNVRFGTE